MQDGRTPPIDPESGFVDPGANVGGVVTTHEYLNRAIEIAVLELSGCSDYRGFALTSHFGAVDLWNIFKVLLKDRFGKESVKTEEFRQLQQRIEDCRIKRNIVVHAEWRSGKLTEYGPVVIAYDRRKHKPFDVVQHEIDADYGFEAARTTMETLKEFLDYCRKSCGLALDYTNYRVPESGEDRRKILGEK